MSQVMAEPVQYMMGQPQQQPVQYMTQQPAMMYAAPQQEVQYVNELGQPCTADGQPLGGEVQYVNELGQPCTADGQLLAPQQEVQYVNELGQPCTADGQPLGGEVQYVNELGQPCTADGQPLMQQVQYGAPQIQYAAQPTTMTYAAPQVYSAPPAGGQPTYTISPERFQLIMQGQPLTNEEIAAMTGAPQAAPVMTMTQGGSQSFVMPGMAAPVMTQGSQSFVMPGMAAPVMTQGSQSFVSPGLSMVGAPAPVAEPVAEPAAVSVALPTEAIASTASAKKSDKKKSDKKKSDKKKAALSSKKKSKGCC